MTDLVDTTEMYLRTILDLEEEGIVPLRARISERLGHSGPTVSQTINRMERDGLVERRGESIDVRLERLRVAFGAAEPEQVCNAVMSELIGSSHVYDDTALLVFRRVG